MIHDVEELPKSRTPHLAQLTTPSVAIWQVGGGGGTGAEAVNAGERDSYRGGEAYPSSSSSAVGRGNPTRTRLGETRTGASGTSTSGPSQDDDTASVNSFKTAPSEPNLTGFVPRQVSDSYETRVLGPAGAPGGAMQVSSSSVSAAAAASARTSRSPSFKGIEPDSLPAKVITRANSYAAEPRGARGRSPAGSSGGGSGGEEAMMVSQDHSLPPGSGRAQVQKLMAKPMVQQQGGQPQHIHWRDASE